VRITVKLFATFRQLLPVENRINGISIEAHKSITPNQILKQLNIPVEQAHILLINGVFVEPERRNLAIFHDNDIFSVWPAVAGG